MKGVVVCSWPRVDSVLTITDDETKSIKGDEEDDEFWRGSRGELDSQLEELELGIAFSTAAGVALWWVIGIEEEASWAPVESVNSWSLVTLEGLANVLDDC